MSSGDVPGKLATHVLRCFMVKDNLHQLFVTTKHKKHFVYLLYSKGQNKNVIFYEHEKNKQKIGLFCLKLRYLFYSMINDETRW